MYNSGNLEDARAFRLYKFLENTAWALKTYITQSFLIIMRAFQYTIQVITFFYQKITNKNLREN